MLTNAIASSGPVNHGSGTCSSRATPAPPSADARVMSTPVMARSETTCSELFEFIASLLRVYCEPQPPTPLRQQAMQSRRIAIGDDVGFRMHAVLQDVAPTDPDIGDARSSATE